MKGLRRLILLGLLAPGICGAAPNGHSAAELASVAALRNATSELASAEEAPHAGGSAVEPLALALPLAGWEVGDSGMGVAVAPRRLFDFSFPDVGGIVNQATDWVESTTNSLASTVGSLPGISDVVNVFNQAKVWVDKGLAVASAAWDTMKQMASHLLKIFTDFSPLKPIFAAKDGLQQLITSRTNLQTLVHTVRNLLGTSSVLETLSNAMARVSEMFTELDTFFKSLLSKLGGRRLSDPTRRLASSYSQLLSGLDFPKLVTEMQGFLKSISSTSVVLLEVQDVLGPLLEKLETTLSGTPLHNSTGVPARRLSVQDIIKNAQKYSGAISKIVPAWQGLESLGIKMCPQVSLSKESASSLQCRVLQFTKQAVGSFGASAIGGLVSGCGGTPQSKDASCPAKSNSAGITDMLSQNSNWLGIILAIVVAGGCLGGGAVAGAKVMGGGGEEEEEDDDDSDDRGEGRRGLVE